MERNSAPIVIMDTTLRDGEQTSGVSFTDLEKFNIAKLLLEDLKVDRIEIASAMVSAGELQGARKITSWAKKHGHLHKIEALGFVDGTRSLDWLELAGVKVLNLLCKGSRKHCELQLKKTMEQHLADILDVIGNALQRKFQINIYLEDWSNGIQDDPDYVFTLVQGLHNQGVNRFMLPDTLGILNHEQTYSLCTKMLEKFPKLHFDFHGHNDYDLGVANIFAAIRAGIDCVHTTLIGLGERAGNPPLSSVVGIVTDHLKRPISINEKKLYSVCKIVESFSGIRIPHNKPIIGENVFTQTSGIHADGDQKNNLYHNPLTPERFNRKREYALGKMAGKSSLQKNLEELGIELDKASLNKVIKRINELGDRKELVTKDDLPYIIADVLETEKMSKNIKIVNYTLTVAAGMKSMATLKLEIEGTVYEETANGDGQYDAFMNALYRIYKPLDKQLPSLIDYQVSIPPGGKTEALCHTTITWKLGNKIFKTNGLDPDQAVAAIKATLKMLNLI